MELSDLTGSTNKATIQILCLPNLPSSNKLSVFTPTISLILCLFWSKLGCVHTGVLKSNKLPCFEMCNHTMLCVWHVYVNAAYKCYMKNIFFSPISVYYFHSLWWSFSFRNIVFRETKVLQAAVVSCVIASNFADINYTKKTFIWTYI